MLLGTIGIAGLALWPRASRDYMEWRSANPVRRGLRLSEELGCFSCHGHLGREGLSAPRAGTAAVPAWDGGEWMMHVDDEDDVRRIILDGSRPDDGGLAMPGYRARIDDDDLEELLAAFLVASGMRVPPAGEPASRGRQLALERSCFSCHGIAGSGGLPNPGSLSGYVPGWYGVDFADLVSDRGEFDLWIRQGGLPRLREHPIARRFIESQRLQMPSYPELSNEDLDALWAYAGWLAQTEGGFRGASAPW